MLDHYLRIVGLEANLKKQDLQKAIDHYSLSNDVEFVLDRINAPSKLMSQCHLGIISSLGSETICRVAEEFLLSGTRIFVSGVGGLEDLLLEKSFGASYNSLNSDAAAQLLNNQLQLSIEETAEDKLARSAVAAKYFGLDEFGNKLLATLES
jgi:hypothetical protein